MTRLYRPMMLNNFRVIFTDIPSAEIIKYAANSMPQGWGGGIVLQCQENHYFAIGIVVYLYS